MIYIKFLELNRLDQQDIKQFDDVIKAELDLHKKGISKYKVLLLDVQERLLINDKSIDNLYLAESLVNKISKDLESLNKDENFGIVIVSPRYFYTNMNLFKKHINNFLDFFRDSILRKINNNIITEK